MNRKHSPKHSPKDSPKDSSPRLSDTLAGAPAPLPLWEKGMRKARPVSSPARRPVGSSTRLRRPRAARTEEVHPTIDDAEMTNEWTMRNFTLCIARATLCQHSVNTLSKLCLTDCCPVVYRTAVPNLSLVPDSSS